MDTLQKVITPSSACNETYFIIRKATLLWLFLCLCDRTHVQYLVNICLDIRLLCRQV